nr:transposase domain-containing protein [Roseomonas marmotae]
MFAGSAAGGANWAIATLIRTALMNDVEPEAWLTDVLQRMVRGDMRSNGLDALLPWNWGRDTAAAA